MPCRYSLGMYPDVPTMLIVRDSSLDWYSPRLPPEPLDSTAPRHRARPKSPTLARYARSSRILALYTNNSMTYSNLGMWLIEMETNKQTSNKQTNRPLNVPVYQWLPWDCCVQIKEASCSVKSYWEAHLPREANTHPLFILRGGRGSLKHVMLLNIAIYATFMSQNMPQEGTIQNEKSGLWYGTCTNHMLKMHWSIVPYCDVQTR